MKTHLTERNVKTFEAGPNGVVVVDDEITGFGLRVTPAGARSFVLAYKIHGRAQQMTVGSWPVWSVAAAREQGQVDVVAVYKIDRLTRSLTDFAKIVEVFDGRGVSFVSITQQFNTTTSMGRLTLNVLLSFAQFEREVRPPDHQSRAARRYR